MKTYVMIHGIANIVAGGPIYDANKARYLEERGWTINVLPTDSGKIYITPFKKYSGMSFPFICQPPFVFSKKELNEKLEFLISYITLSDQIVIETGTDYTAMWGELLAKRLKAKHIVIFLDEKNPKVNKYTRDFYKFKYKRNELASISMKSLQHIFLPYFELDNPDHHTLLCCCMNVVGTEDPRGIVNRIPDADYVIGSIGRLNKGFVPNILEGICQFAKALPNKKIGVCLLGGAEESILRNVKRHLDSFDNIEYYISGYIWPIPKEVFLKIDVFISGAGSAWVSANQGITTIEMDVIDYYPLGLFYDLNQEECLSLNKKNATVCDYLYEVLIYKNIPEIVGKCSLEKEWKWICNCFDEHMRFLEASCKEAIYYQTESLWNGSLKDIVKKMVFHFIHTDTWLVIKKKFKL